MQNIFCTNEIEKIISAFADEVYSMAWSRKWVRVERREIKIYQGLQDENTEFLFTLRLETCV